MPDTLVGTGVTPHTAEVNATGEVLVRADSNPSTYFDSLREQRTFNAVMPSFSASNGEYVLYVKNTHPTLLLHIESIEYHSVEAAHWKVWHVTGTAAGATIITPSLLNLDGNRIADATVMGGAAAITGLTTVAQIGTHRTTALSEAGMNFGDALFLGNSQAIAVEYDTGTTGLCEIDCIFSYVERV